MKRDNVLKIAKKEIQAYLNSPASYIVAIVFLLLWEFMFFRNAFLIGEASLRGLYGMFPWLMLILVPAVTMGTIGKEREDGTVEWILTQPISDLEFVVGKFLGAVTFITIVLAFVLPIAISFSKFGQFDWGVFGGQFLGGILFGAAFAALGLFVSSLVTSQIAALLVSVAAGFILILCGTDFFTAALPISFATVAERLSLAVHLDSMARGVLDIRDLWYFLSFIFVFLGLTYLQMLKQRFGNRKAMYRSFQLGVVLLIVITVLTNVLGNRISGRIDLTQGRLYTLAGSTKTTLKNLDDIVTITFYVSDKLPVQYSPVVRETKDLLRDYQNIAKSNLVVKTKNPSDATEIAAEAATYGVREVQFNVIGQEEFQLKTGYIGLVVTYAGKHEAIPFIQTTADLEYQLTSFIKNLTAKDRKIVKFLAGHGEKDPYTDYSLLMDELAKQFEVSTLALEVPETDEQTETPPPVIDPSVDAVVVAGPNLVMGADVQDALTNYIDQGGSVLFLVDTYTINMENQNVSENANSLADLVSQYGVTVNKDVLYDVRSNETVRFSDGFISYFLAYPYWMKTLPLDQTNPITFKMQSVLMPWAASLSVDDMVVDNMGYTLTSLVNTSPYAGAKTENIRLDPGQDFPTDSLGEKQLAVALTKVTEDGTGGSLIVVGDSDFLTNQFIQPSPENVVFGLNAISWLTDEDSLGDIRIKENPFGKFLFEDLSQPAKLKTVNMAIAGLVPAVYGAVRLYKRRQLSKLRYKKSK